MNRIGIFLDRDGTINKEIDYLCSPSELHLLPQSAEAIGIANKLGLNVFIITNQSGIARGILTEEQLDLIHKTLISKLHTAGAKVDAIYYCPHHPDTGLPQYRKDCDCRKPKTGMLLQASKEFTIDLSKSFVIGDKMIDIQTGIACGANSILVLTGYGKEELKLCRTHKISIDFIASNLIEALNFIKEKINKEQHQNAIR
jgi:D-glycero-D-manno-heptose 1,7-bisphosphate phosphatase